MNLLCPNCQKPLTVPDQYAGQPMRCPLCQGTFAVAAPPVAANPPQQRAAPPAPPAQPSPPVPAPVVQQPAPRPAPPAITAPPPPPPAPSRREDEEPPPPPARRKADDTRKGEDAPGPSVVLEVKRDPDGELKGIYVGELTDRGLRMSQGEDRFRVRIGTHAEHTGGNRISLDLGGRDVSFAVGGFVAPAGTTWLSALMRNHRTYKHRLAADLVAFVRGQRDTLPRPEGYLMPWYLFVPALLPLGIPVLTLGGLLPVLAGILLSAACAAILQRERLPTVLRLGLSLGISFVSYAVVIGILVLVTGVADVKYGYHKKPTLSEKSWQTYRSPDGDFEVLLPGKPEVLTNPHPGVQVKLSRPEVTFRVHYFTVEPARRLDLTDPVVVSSAPEVWPEMLEPVLLDYNESKRNYGSEGVCPALDKHCRFTDANRKRSHQVTTDCFFGRFGDRVYCATVSSTNTGGWRMTSASSSSP